MTEPNKGDKRKRPAMDESEGSKKSISVTPKRKRLSEDYGPGQGSSGGPSGSGTPVSRKTVPLSERQQMALLMQMAAQERPDAGGLSPQQGGSTTPGSAQTPRSSLDRKINKRNERGETPLHLAAIRGDLKQVKQLMKAQAEVNVQDFAGWTPLHEACNHGFLDVAKCLLKGGALVNAQGADNDTPLHDAAINGNPDLVKLLLRFGADAHQANSAGRTPLDVAANTEITKLLLMRKKELFSGSSSDSEYDIGSRSPQPSSPDSMQPDEDLELSADTLAGAGSGISVVQRPHETKAANAGESSAAREQSPSRWSSWTGSGGEPKRAKMSLSFPGGGGGGSQLPHASAALTLQTSVEGAGSTTAADLGSSACSTAAGAATAAATVSQGQGPAAAYDLPAGNLTAARLMAASSSAPIELLASLPLTSGNGAGGFTTISVGGSHCQQLPSASQTQPTPSQPPPQQHQPMAAAATQAESSLAKESDGCDMEVEAIALRSQSDEPAVVAVPVAVVHSDSGVRTAALGAVASGGGTSGIGGAVGVGVGSICGRMTVPIDGCGHQQQLPPSALAAVSTAAAAAPAPLLTVGLNTSGPPVVGTGATGAQQRTLSVASLASTSEGERQSPVPERGGSSSTAAAAGRLMTSAPEGKSHHQHHHHHPAGGVSSGGGSSGNSGTGTERRGSMHSQHRSALGEERATGRERRDRESRQAAAIVAAKEAAAVSVAGAVTAAVADTTSAAAKRELLVPPKEVPVTAPADSSSQAVTGQPPAPATGTAGGCVTAGGGAGPEVGGGRLPEKEQQAGVTRSSRTRDRLMKSGTSAGGNSAAGAAGNGSGSCGGSSSSSSSGSSSSGSVGCSSGSGGADADGGAEFRELRRGEQRRGSGPRERDAGSPGGDRNKPSSPKVPPLKIILPSKSPTAKDLPYVVSGTEPQADGAAVVAAATSAAAAAASSSCPAGESSVISSSTVAGTDVGAPTASATAQQVQAAASLNTGGATMQPSTATAVTTAASGSSSGAAAASSSAVPAVMGAGHKEEEPAGGTAADVEEKETISRRTLRSHTHSMQQRLQQQLQQMGNHQQASSQASAHQLQQQLQQQQQATTTMTTQQPTPSQQVPQPGQSHAQPPPAGVLGTSAISVPVGGQSGSTEEHINIHPRKRKLRPRPEPTLIPQVDLSSSSCMHTNNPYQLSAELRKEVWKKRESMFSVAPKPPNQFQDYLMSNHKYLLAGNDRASASGAVLAQPPPPSITTEPLKDLFVKQEDDRRRLRLRHQVEREKLSLAIEQETLRVHGRAARAVANQEVPLGFCSILRDTEIYNVYHPFHVKINVNKEEDRDRNTNRSHYNNRQFLSWLQDVDDKFEKIKESMLTRQRHEAACLHAVQRMDWEWKLKELGLCDYQSQPVIDAAHVPVVAVNDDIELLPA